MRPEPQGRRPAWPWQLALLGLASLAVPLLTPAPGRAEPSERAAATVPVVLAAALPPAPPPPAAAPLAPARAELDLFVNGEAKGPIEVLVDREGDDAWADPADLERAGLQLPEGRRTGLAGSRRISLRSLAPALTYQVDERALELRLSAGPELLGRRRLDLRSTPRPEGLVVRGDASAFLDYAVEGNWPGSPTASLELGTSGGGWLALGGVTRQESGVWTRGLSSLTRDEPETLRRWIAGDAVAAGGPLGGSLVLGGLSLQREFSLDPYRVASPLPSGTAVATSPSTLEVYVNGTLVRRERLAPGTYDLANLPVSSGAGVVQAVLRDAYGRTQELDSRYYYSSGLLAEGLGDYGYHLGFARRAAGGLDEGYGAPVVLARHRLGLSESLTVGLRAEASRGLVSGGPSATLATPFGQLDAAVAASGGTRAGAAAQLSWSYQQRGLSAGLRLAAQGPAYATASLAPGQDRALVSADALAGAALARWISLEGGLRLERRRDAGAAASATLRSSLALAPGAGLVLAATLGRQPGGAADLEVLALLSWSLGPRVTADASARRGPGGTGQALLGVQQPLPRDEGFGYRATGGGGGGSTPGQADLLGQAQGPFGRYEAEWQQVGRAQSGRASAAGALVFIDGRLFATRPVESSFALLRVPEVEGVRGLLENQLVGRTDRDGDLLVPALLPYQANRLSIRGEDVPLEFELGPLDQLVAPPLRGGAVARFAVRRLSAVTGALGVGGAAGPGDRQRPENGEVVVHAGDVRVVSPVASGGRFWLEGLPPGSHRALVTWRGGSCQALLEVGGNRGPGGPIADLGEVPCEPEEELRAAR